MRTLDRIVRSGRALHVGISSYSADDTAQAQQIMRELGTPLVIHQPSYSLLNRWIEKPSENADGPAGGKNLVQVLGEAGMGSIVFTPLAQGMLTDKYLNGIPEDSRAAASKSLNPEWLTDENIERIRGLNEIAQQRGQTLAQMAIAWTLRPQDGGQVTSALVGASSAKQIADSAKAVENLEFSQDELSRIDELARDAGVNIWAKATESTKD